MTIMEKCSTTNKMELTYNFILGLIVFLIVLFPKLIAIGFILLLLMLIFAGVKRQIQFVLHPVLIGFVLFYLAYFVGSFFTNNAYLAGNYLEYKLSFILIPILFSFRPKFPLKHSYSIIGLVVGVFFASILGIKKAIGVYYSTGNVLTSFTSSSICIDHPTYYASFVITSLVGVIYFYRTKEKGFVKAWVIPYSIFAVVMIFLSYSMAAILFLMLLIAFIVLKWMFLSMNKRLILLLILVFPFLLFWSLTKIPQFKDEIKNSTDAFKEYVKNPSEYVMGKAEYPNGYKNRVVTLTDGLNDCITNYNQVPREYHLNLNLNPSPSGDKIRLIMWTVSAKECIKHPFGVGTGNVDEALSVGLTEINQIELAKKNDRNEIVYNPHNQFLQTTLEIGVIGLLIFVFILFKSFQIGFRSNNWFLIMVVSSLIFNSFFESVLQRQSGIVFYTMIICLFSLPPSIRKAK